MLIPGFVSIIATVLTASIVISCSQAENKNLPAKPTVQPTQTAAPIVSTPASPTATPSVSVPAAPPATRLRDLPPEGGDKPTAAEVGGYPYSYKKDGGKTVATFAPKLLLADEDILTAAARDIIYRSYRDKTAPALRIEGSGPAETLRIDGSNHQYIVVPIKEPTGEIRSLMITQLN